MFGAFGLSSDGPWELQISALRRVRNCQLLFHKKMNTSTYMF